MEGMREIARSYYERASEDEKTSIKELFRKLDVNGDGKISLKEFKKSVSSWLCAEAVFEKLDTNGDGSLDFEEFLCLHYIEKKVNIARCGGCWELLVGPYFSCLLCMGRGGDTFDLCCSCYRHAVLAHHHSSNYMLDHHSLLMVFRDRTTAAEKLQNKKHMEELREIAKAHYRAGSPEVQALAYEFYQSMDTDRDGRVDLSEFLAFMRQEGYSYMQNTFFFNELDHDGNGTLDFSEVMTLYYIIKSGRPFCDCCRTFIPGTFFSCVECFKNAEKSFDLCRDCYRSAGCTHNHGGRAQFLDNYTLLQVGRDPSLAHSSSALNPHPACNLSTNAIVPVQYNTHVVQPPTNVVVPASSTNWAWNLPTNAIVPVPVPVQYNTHVVQPPNAVVPASSTDWSKWRVALHAFELALSIGNVSATLCTIL